MGLAVGLGAVAGSDACDDALIFFAGTPLRAAADAAPLAEDGGMREKSWLRQRHGRKVRVCAIRYNVRVAPRALGGMRMRRAPTLPPVSSRVRV